MEQTILKWLDSTKGAEDIAKGFRLGKYRGIENADEMRLRVPAIYLRFSKTHGRRILGEVYHLSLDIGRVSRKFADIYIHESDFEDIREQPLKVSRYSGRILLKGE